MLQPRVVASARRGALDQHGVVPLPRVTGSMVLGEMRHGKGALAIFITDLGILKVHKRKKKTDANP